MFLFSVYPLLVPLLEFIVFESVTPIIVYSATAISLLARPNKRCLSGRRRKDTELVHWLAVVFHWVDLVSMLSINISHGHILNTLLILWMKNVGGCVRIAWIWNVVVGREDSGERVNHLHLSVKSSSTVSVWAEVTFNCGVLHSWAGVIVRPIIEWTGFPIFLNLGRKRTSSKMSLVALRKRCMGLHFIAIHSLC